MAGLGTKNGKPIDFNYLRTEAIGVLEDNRLDGFTKPSPKLYPHQWSWDSAFIAFGYAHVDQEKAQQELLSLFKGQWRNGLVPHIVFHTGEGGYFPGPDFWRIQSHPAAPTNPATSGIIQPPIHASAALHVYRNAPEEDRAKDFLRTMFPALTAWHDFIYRERDSRGEGLAVIVHPWESGQDNSPIWDELLEKIKPGPGEIPQYERKDLEHVACTERPEKADYDRYVYLVKFMYDRNYDQKRISAESPFRVQDVLFNSVLAQAGRDLAEIAIIVGEDGRRFEEQAEVTSAAVNDKLWDEHHGMYNDFDLTAGRQIDVHSGSGFLPLFAGIPDKKRANRMIKYLNSKAFCPLHEKCYAVPSYDMDGIKFSPNRYWRGPVWININWFIYYGCRRYGFDGYADWVKEAICELPWLYGFHEYYDPYEGKGYGTDRFSWTASLLLDILSRDPAEIAGDESETGVKGE